MMAEETHYQPRTVVLVKGKKGFGFVLKGAKGNFRVSNCVDEFRPTPSHPALQYIEKVDPGSVSDKAGLKVGDYLLEVNGENVVSATHDHCVELIRKSGQMLALKVVTLKDEEEEEGTLKRPKSLAFPPPLPPKRSPSTQLSVGRTRSKSIAEGLAHLEELDRTLAEYDRESLAPSEIHRSMDDVTLRNKQPASIRSRPSSQRIDPDELNDLFSRTQPPQDIDLEVSASNRDKPKVNNVRTYANTAELKAECARRKMEKQNAIGGFMVRTQSTPNLAQFDDSGVDDWRTSLGEDDNVFQTPGSSDGSHIGSQDGSYAMTPDSGMSQRDHLYSSHNKPKTKFDSPAERRKRNLSSSQPPKLESTDSRSSLQGDVVAINTKPEKIYSTPGPAIPSQDFESSFRPGTDAKFTTAPAFKAQVRPPLHERIYANPVQQIYATPKDQMIYATPRQQNIYDAPRQSYIQHGNDVTAASYSSGYGQVVSRRGDVIFRQNGVKSSDVTMTRHRGVVTSTPKDVQRRHDLKRHDAVVTSPESDTVMSTPYIPAPDYDLPSDMEKKPLNTGPSIQSVLLDRQSRTAYRNEPKGVNPKNAEVALASRVSRTAYRAETKTPEIPLISNDSISSNTNSLPARLPSAKPNVSRQQPLTTPTATLTNSKPDRTTSKTTTVVQKQPVLTGKPPPPPVTSKPRKNTSVASNSAKSAPAAPPAPAPPPPPPIMDATTPPKTSSASSSKPSSAETTPRGTITASDLQKAIQKRQARIEEKAKNPLAAVPKKKERNFETDIKEAVQKRQKAMEEKQAKEPSKIKIVKKTENPNFRLGTMPKREGVKAVKTRENPAPQVPSRDPVKPKDVKRKDEYDTLKLMAGLRASLRAKKAEEAVVTEEKPSQNGTVINGIHVIMDNKTEKEATAKPATSAVKQVPAEGNPVTREMSFTARAERLRQEYLRRKQEQKRRESNCSLDSVEALNGVPETQSDKPLEEMVHSNNANDVVHDERNDEVAEINERTPDLDHNDSQSIRSTQSNNSTPSSGFHDNYSDLSISRPESLRNSVLEIDITREKETIPDSGQHSPVSSDQSSVTTLLATFRDKPIDTWNNADICDWLQSLNLSEYSSNFAEHEIDGGCLVSMTRHDFTDIGVTRVGHRMHMERSIKQRMESS